MRLSILVEHLSFDVRYYTTDQDLDNLVSGRRVLAVMPIKMSDKHWRVHMICEVSENQND